MPRIVRCSLIQASNVGQPDQSLAEVKQAMIAKHETYIAQAAAAGSQITCLQEIFYGPYFCAEQQTRWYDFTEPIPDGPTIRRMQDLARQHHMAIIVPIYEIESEGVYYNTAAVIDNTGKYLGKYRKNHIPHVAPGFWEKFYFRPGSEHLWKIEQPAHAVANGYFVAAINRVGVEAPWNIGHFYGTSYFCNPRGQIVAQASREKDEVLTADLDLDQIKEVRQTWQFFRDRRPDSYADLVKP